MLQRMYEAATASTLILQETFTDIYFYLFTGQSSKTRCLLYRRSITQLSLLS